MNIGRGPPNTSLPYVSANDLAHEPGLLTDEERRYIANFIKRWVMETQTLREAARWLVTGAERAF